MNHELLQPLVTYQANTLPMTTTSAAVMVILLDNAQEEWEIVLTKRAANLHAYSNHYSFPGGKRDDTDNNLYETAQRETWEEIHIEASTYQYITQLDDFHDRYGHLVRPFVVCMPKDVFLKQVQPSEDEIAFVYYFPFSSLSKLEDNPLLHSVTKRQPSYSYTDGDEFIWGLTAAILVHFANILFSDNRPLTK